jgi:hypothetical protein
LIAIIAGMTVSRSVSQPTGAPTMCVAVSM